MSIPAKPGPRPAPPRRRARWSLLLPGLLGLALLVEAIPASLSALHRAPHIEAMRSLTTVSPDRLLQAAQAAEQGLGHRGDGRHWAELGQLRCALADRAGRLGGAVYRDGCIEAIDAALAREAVLPYAALRQSLALIRRDGPGPRAYAAYRRSVDTGSGIPALILPRARLALAAWPSFDPATREAASGQIRLAAALYPDALALAAATPGRQRLVERVLSEAPPALSP